MGECAMGNSLKILMDTTKKGGGPVRVSLGQSSLRSKFGGKAARGNCLKKWAGEKKERG